MKIKDLLDYVEEYKEKYPNIKEWEIYSEQLTEYDKEYKRTIQKWEYFSEGGYDNWEYFRCCGFSTLFPEKKIFTINVNY